MTDIGSEFVRGGRNYIQEGAKRLRIGAYHAGKHVAQVGLSNMGKYILRHLTVGALNRGGFKALKYAALD